MYQDNYFAVSVKIIFRQRQTHCIDDQDKFQSLKDSDNEFTECQTRGRKFRNTKVQVNCVNNSGSDSYDKMTCKRK